MDMNRLPFVNGWRFALTEEEAAVLSAFDDSAFRQVTLPHDWQIEQTRTADAPGKGAQGFFPREQMGVYRLRFTAEEAWRGKRVRILFDGVQRFSDVYLNGQRIGGHAFGYVPFLCDMTDALRFGEDNLLAVRVDNRAHEGEYLASGDRWYSGAGICRNVWLLVDEAVHLAHDGLRIVAEPVHKGPSGDVPDVAGIQCDTANVVVTAEVEGDAAGQDMTLTILDPDGRTIHTEACPAQRVTRWTLQIHRPRLWSPDTPYLYRARVALQGDAQESSFGIRSAVFDTEEGFLLNGVKTKLWGVNLHHDGGVCGAAVPIEVWRRRLISLKKTGANTIRCAHHPMAEEFYDLCDELGFLVVDELCDKWEGCGMYFDRVWADRFADLAAMIRRDGNHPSIILWSVGNEISHQFSEKFYTYLKELVDEVRSLDPSRPVTAVLIGCVLRDFNDVTPMGRKLEALRRYAELVDVVCGNYMEHYYEKMREYGIRKPVIGSEVRTLYRLDEKTLNSVQVSPESPYAIVRKYDWVCGALLWAGIDYLGEASFWPLRGWTGNILDSTADWKLRAWYCAAHWRSDPVLKIGVYDESEPWDGARGLWGFPQMRSHWKYTQFEKVFHVAAMTNCDTVKLYQNSQTVRVGYLKDFPDGMIHFYLPYIPGVLRAEGYIGGRKVAEDVLYSDHEAVSLTVTADRTDLPADGNSVAMIDLTLEDAHGRRYMLEDRMVRIALEGPATFLCDNGNAYSLLPFDAPEQPMFNGHMLVMVRAGHQAGEARLTLTVEGFEPRVVTVRIGEGVTG